MIKELRCQCGAGVMECRSALVEAGGDMAKALDILKARGFIKAEKSAGRATAQGLIESYIHTGGRIGVLVEVKCETDFVARTADFKELAHCLALQIAALAPKYVSADEVPPGADADPQQACLLLQPYIKEPTRTVNDLVVEVIAKTGENIRVTRFARFELGEQ
ncbi:MAG: elongation factor Ts [Chloroflexi bacterium]|nr:elongation factor Ts [Chloroflexota bacterium]